MFRSGVKWLIVVGVAVGVALLLNGFVGSSCLIPYSGMENTLYPGDRIVVNKWSYGLRLPLMKYFPYRRWKERAVRNGEIVVFNNPADLKHPVIDQRALFIGRCVGSPGDTVLLDSLFFVVTSPSVTGPDQKALYTYPREKESRLDSLLTRLSIDNSERMGEDDSLYVRSLSRYEYYLICQELQPEAWITPLQTQEEIAYHLMVPGKGKTIKIYPWNMELMRNTLKVHENRDAEIRGDTLYVDGVASPYCCFTRDYYWIASNHAANLTDSRLFGFVPEDHLIGKPAFVWFSKEPATGPLGGYRWKRILTRVN
ncbi:MAG: S26 family signal peptidase [Bacteroides sp.]|nr:S26 family signal peptidase [Bacteroides sp.]